MFVGWVEGPLHWGRFKVCLIFLGGGNSKIFYVHPYWFPFDSYFQMRWFNHQLIGDGSLYFRVDWINWSLSWMERPKPFIFEGRFITNEHLKSSIKYSLNLSKPQLCYIRMFADFKDDQHSINSFFQISVLVILLPKNSRTELPKKPVLGAWKLRWPSQPLIFFLCLK